MVRFCLITFLIALLTLKCSNNPENYQKSFNKDDLKQKQLDERKSELNRQMKNLIRKIKKAEKHKQIYLNKLDINRCEKKLRELNSKIVNLTKEIEKKQEELAVKKSDLKGSVYSEDYWKNKYEEEEKYLNLVFSSIRELSDEIKRINLKADQIDRNLLRRIYRSLNGYKKYLGVNELPNLSVEDLDLLSHNKDEITNILNNALSENNIEAWRDSITKQISMAKSEKQQQISELKNDITKLESSIQQIKNQKEESENRREKFKTELNEMKKNRKENLTDVEKTISKLRNELNSTWNQFVLLQFEYLVRISPSYERQKKHFLDLENQIFINSRKISVGEALIDLINKRMDELLKLIKTAERQKYVFNDLYQGEPFLMHYNLGDSTKFSEIEPTGKYHKSFQHQLKILKDFVIFFPGTKIYIDGHADRLEFKNEDYYLNVDLSKGRSNNIEKLFRRKGIITDSTDVILDWFSKYVNKRLLKPDLVESDSGGVSDRRVEIRVIRPFKKGEKIPERITKYLNFRDSLKINLGNGRKKFFKHENGYWIEFGYESLTSLPIVKIRYRGEAYSKLLANQDFKKITKLYQAEEIPPVCKIENITRFELGSQIKLLLKIKKQLFKIEVCRRGKDEINTIRNNNFREYLLSIR